MESVYFLALSTGFLGGFGHCIGMCGPIVASYSMHKSGSRSTRIISHLLYNSGRISTYMFTGAVAGLAGSFVNVAGNISGIQNAVAFIAGIFMIIMGLNISGLLGNTTWLEGHSNFLLRAGKELFGEKSIWKYFPLGAIFGLLPCGLSYTQFISAAGTGNFFQGMMITFLFGIGTLPALLLFGLTASYISARIRGMLYRAAGVIVIALGVLYLIRVIKFHA
jgi:sulfite exporter TauE/SafE